jgi:hypothetical protein
MEDRAMLRRATIGLGLGLLLVLGGGTASVTAEKMGKAHQGVECEDDGAVIPGGGQSSGSRGSPFTEEGTGGQNYSETSQYDVACFGGPETRPQP